jgi:hypothetical protein
MALLATFLLVSVGRATGQMKFDFGKLDNLAMQSAKEGGTWFVHYGQNKEGYVVYAIFAKAKDKGHSPVTSRDTLRSDGSHETTLTVQIDGRDIPPPNPANNSLVIVEGSVKRGQFKPMPQDAFRIFLRDRESPSVSLIETFSKKDGQNANETPK